MSVILVTGAEGHLMRAVIPKLLEQGHYVIGFDNMSRHPDMKRMEYYSEKYIGYTVDCTSYDEMWSAITLWQSFHDERKIDYIIQGAATIYGVGGFNNYCSDVINNDLAIQAQCLRIAKEFTIKKFVYLSSSMVYEKCRQKYDGNSENEPFEDIQPPATEYGLSKYVGEKMVLAANKQYGLDYVIWRPFNILNPSEIADPVQGDSHVFADFIHEIIGEQKVAIPIFGSGKQIRCFTWIDDVARAIAEYSFLDTKDELKIYNIGVRDPVAMIDLAQIISDIGAKLGLCKSQTLRFITVKDIPLDVKYRVPNVDKIRNTFGFEVTKTLEEGIRECLLQYARKKIKW